MIRTVGSRVRIIDPESSDNVSLSYEDNDLKRNVETQQWPDRYSWHSVDTDGNNSLHLESDMLTIEGLRKYYNSCSSCGVSWLADHVTLDCDQCDGYAMYRPCPDCDGQCDSLWRRDILASHQNRKACWKGTCNIRVQSHCVLPIAQETVLQKNEEAADDAL